jgi:hypothetical protein
MPRLLPELGEDDEAALLRQLDGCDDDTDARLLRDIDGAFAAGCLLRMAGGADATCRAFASHGR